MKIWVDADACPNPVKEIVSLAAARRKVEAVFVANQPIQLYESPYLKFKLVGGALDAADEYIHQESEPGDLAITADIPLAKNLVDGRLTVIDHRGTLFCEDNINEVLATRDLMTDLRDQGEVSSGGRPYSQKDKRLFASAFDRELTRLISKDGRK